MVDAQIPIQPHCFGSTEIASNTTAARRPEQPLEPIEPEFNSKFLDTATAHHNFNEVYSKAKDWNDGAGMFMAWAEKLRGPLTLAYIFFLVLAKGGHQSMMLALRDDYFTEHRQRIPRTPKPALIAIQIVAKPQEETDKQACSDYAKLLEHAALLEVMPSDFAEAMSWVKLKDVKRKSRKNRATAPEEARASNAASEAPTLDMPFTDTCCQAIVNDPLKLLPIEGKGNLLATYEWDDHGHLTLTIDEATAAPTATPQP